jgi:hypothetical protein
MMLVAGCMRTFIVMKNYHLEHYEQIYIEHGSPMLALRQAFIGPLSLVITYSVVYIES